MNTPLSSIDIIGDDRDYLDLVRGISITRVVLVHLGLSWFFSPYSDFIHAFMPLLFFVSGAVSYNSYLRSNSLSVYLFKRLSSIYIPYILVISISILVSYFFLKNYSELSVDKLLNIATVNLAEKPEYMPYPVGQVWFIHSIIIIIIITAPLFRYGRYSIILFPAIIITTLLIGILQQQINIGKSMFLFGHNLYQPLINTGFFLAGSLYYASKTYLDKIITILILLSIVVFSLSFIFVDNINMYHHIYAPDIYYISLSYLIILLFVYLKKYIENAVSIIKVIRMFFMFMSENAYSVFMIHSLVLWFVHNKIGIGSVKNNIGMALIKIVIVFIVTCILSIPLTNFTNKIKNIFLYKLIGIK